MIPFLKWAMLNNCQLQLEEEVSQITTKCTHVVSFLLLTKGLERLKEKYHYKKYKERQ